MTQMPSPLDLADTLEGVYDPWNRLVETDDATTAVAYAYDGLNRRITKASGGSTRHYYYSDQWQVLEERLDSDTTADRQYVWGLRYIDDLVLRDTTSERLYALQDALFNVVALTDDDGDVVERFAYQPYGQSEELDPDYTVYSGTNYQWSYRFTGRELDLETGLQINRVRYLHLQLGRWLTRDPIGQGMFSIDGRDSFAQSGARRLASTYLDGFGLYEYSRSNPTLHVDPSGEYSVCCTFGSSGRIWSETIDCREHYNLSAIQSATACCRDAAQGWFWDYKVWAARPARCNQRPKLDPCANSGWTNEPDWLACMAKCLNCFDNPGGKTTRITVAAVASSRVKKEKPAKGAMDTTYRWVKRCQTSERRMGSKTIRAARVVGRVGTAAIIIEGAFAWTSLTVCQMDCDHKPLRW